LRGFRIEPAEVERILVALPDVRAAAVVLHEGTSGDKALLAYVAARQPAQLRASDLRTALGQSLPDYMVPAHFVVLDELPLTPSGKVDRKALPAPTPARTDSAYTAPRGDTERVVAAIWSEILGVERVSVHDNFFELGGHSLLATRVMSKVRAALSIELPLRALFEAPTIAALGERLAIAARERSRPVAPEIKPVTADFVIGSRDLREMEEGRV
jgi:acyl carrier protein